MNNQDRDAFLRDLFDADKIGPQTGGLIDYVRGDNEQSQAKDTDIVYMPGGYMTLGDYKNVRQHATIDHQVGGQRQRQRSSSSRHSRKTRKSKSRRRRTRRQ